MNPFRLYGKSLLILALSGLLLQCSGEESEKSFKVLLDFKAPLMQRGATTYRGKPIPANWFATSFSVVNNSGMPVRIEAVEFYVSVDGTERGPFFFDLSLLDLTNSDTGTKYSYNSYCIYPSTGAIITFSACLENTLKDPNDVDDSPPHAFPLTMYISGIPMPTLTDSLAHPVRMVMYGIYLKDGVDHKRFEKTVYFSTR